MSVHQLAFLTPDRMVAWKCLSLQALESSSMEEFAPVAYASRSDAFFRDIPHGRPLRCGVHSPDAVLWVISCPKFKSRGGKTKAFPPTLTAKIVVKKIVTGDVVRSWAQNPRDANLTVPAGDATFQAWRRAESVRGAIERATFRITRGFAMLSWKKWKKSRTRFTESDAWASVRTAIADPRHSYFLAHTNATECLSGALGICASVKECARNVAWKLMSPRVLPAAGATCVEKLEQLADAGLHNTIFMSYRWNKQMDEVFNIGAALLDQGRGIWLDRAQIPALKSQPVWRLSGETRRKDPPRIELEHLLEDAIESSSLFLCMAGKDYADPPKDDPDGKNWTQKEYEYAVECFRSHGQPRVGIVDLGGAPKGLEPMQSRRWRYRDEAIRIARSIAGDAGR